MKVEFENNFQKKVMIQSFPEKTVLGSDEDVMMWRKEWMSALSSWHSPYKVIVDCENLSISDEKVKEPLARMLKFFEGFFLKKVVGFTANADHTLQGLPFEIFPSEWEAAAAVGLKEGRQRSQPGDFRSSLQIQNHFQQHSVELTLTHDAMIDSAEKLDTLRSKLTNNLMQWHSGWNLIIDCSHLEFSESQKEPFRAMASFFQGLFLKDIVGYSPKGAKETYPFPVFRSRHKAVANLEAEGAFSGNEADCNSRK